MPAILLYQPSFLAEVAKMDYSCTKCLIMVRGRTGSELSAGPDQDGGNYRAASSLEMLMHIFWS